MKSANVKIRRMTAVVLMLLAGLLMCSTGLLPSEASAEETSTTIQSGTSSTSSISSQLLDFNEKIDQECNTTAESPYGTEAGQTFMLSTQNELLFQTSHDIDKSSGQNISKYYDGLNSGTSLLKNTEDSSAESGLSIPALSFSEAVAFDATGSGRKDHVAYVGYDQNSDKNNGAIVLYILNTTNNKISDKLFLTPENRDDKIWLESKSPIQYQAMHFFSITAGDYNGDGKDSIVLYVCDNENDFSIKEYKCSDDTNGKPQTPTFVASSQKVLSPTYQNPGDRFLAYSGYLYNSSSYSRNKLGVSLDTGDLNGDGIDDLAVLSYCNNIEEEPYVYNTNIMKPYLFIGYGGQNSTLQTMEETDNSTLQAADSKTTAYEPSVTIGDVDGDGNNEVLVAGYTCNLESNGYSKNQDEIIIYWYKTTQTTDSEGKVSYSQNKKTDRITTNTVSRKYSGIKDGDAAASQVVTACVAINGQTAARSVFINGALYDLSSGEAVLQFTNGLFDTTVSNCNRYLIQSVAVGNFDNNDAGREQIYFTVGFQKSGGGDDYFYYTANIAGNQYDDTKDTSGKVTNYGKVKNYSNKYDANVWENLGNTGSYPIAFGSGNHQRLNCNVVAIDRDTDGVMAKYTGRWESSTDPEVVAVLQAAPWFGELGTYGDFQGSTSYGISRSYSLGTIASETASYGVGMSFEAETPGFKTALETGYSKSMTTSFEKELTKTYSTEFTATSQDSVVLTRTPEYIYSYETYSNNSEAPTGSISIAVPQQPTYYQMTVDGYNSFVDLYNQKLSDKNIKGQDLLKLADKYLGNEGNPFGYRNSWPEGSTQLSQYQIELGYGASTGTSSFSTETADTLTTQTSKSSNFSTTISVGGETAGIGAWASVSQSVELAADSGSYKSQGTEKSTSGQVYNISQQDLLYDYNIPYDISDKYGFKWTFGSWKAELSENKNSNNYQVPVFGYCLTNLHSPSMPVDDLTANMKTVDTAVLSWSMPDTGSTDVIERSQVTGFNVYQIEPDNTYTKLNENPLPETQVNFTAENLSTNTTYGYVVTTLSDVGESVYSNKAEVTTPKKNLPVSLKVIDREGNTSDGAVITAKHLGNVLIVDGDTIPETSFIYVTVEAQEGYEINEVTLTNGSDSPVAMPESFTFALSEPTTISVKVSSRETSVLDSQINFRSITLDQADNLLDNGRTGGTVSAKVGSASLVSGGTVTMPNAIDFEATAEDGYVLKEWHIFSNSADYANDTNAIIKESGGNSTLSYTPDSNITYIAPVFVDMNNPSLYRTITINQTTGGTISAKDASGQILEPDENGQISVVAGSKVTFEATNNEHYNFKGWTGLLEGVGTLNPFTIHVTLDITVGANFNAPVQYSIRGNGCTVTSGDSNVKPDQTMVPGSEITFKAQPKEGKYIEQWNITDNEGNVTTVPLSIEESAASVSNETVLTLILEQNVTVEPIYVDRTLISSADIQIAAPVAGETAPTAVTDAENHLHAGITWSPEPADGRFQYNTAYTATVVVTPESPIYMIDPTEGAYTINGSSDGVSYSDGSEESVTLKLTFDSTEEHYDVTSVELSDNTLSLNTGSTYSLTAAVLPDNASNKSVTWSSSDPAVADVDTDGTVSALSAGTAQITATAENGSSDVCDVTVMTPSVAYKVRSQSKTWSSEKTDGKTAGTAGSGSLTQLNIQLTSLGADDNIQYRVRSSNNLWPVWSGSGKDAATWNGADIEAVKMELTGNISTTHDLYYRTYNQGLGWSDWAVNGQETGTTGYYSCVQAIQIILQPKTEAAPGAVDDPLMKAESVSLENGATYTIKTALSSSRVLDIKDGSTSNGANVQTWTGNGSTAQQFKAKKNSDGTWSFINVKSGKALDIAGNSSTSGANVQQYGSNGTSAQKWKLTDAGNGSVFVMNLNGLALDVSGGKSANGANVQVYKFNGSKAEQFVFTKVNAGSSTTVLPDQSTKFPYVYTIKSKLDQNMVMDISGGSTSNGANLQLYKNTSTAAQQFKILSAGEGKYYIQNVQSGKVLDVSGAGTANGTNVAQYAYNGSAAQRWYIVMNIDGSVTFISDCNGLALDAAGASTSNGTNIQCYQANTSAAQKWVMSN